MKNIIGTFKVYLEKEVYRVIEIKADKSLYDLALAITDAFEFDFDHAFGFYSNLEGNIYDSEGIYELFTDVSDEALENALGVKNEIIHGVFTKFKEMAFLYDYGDDWVFLVECDGFSEMDAKVTYPRVIQDFGEAPEQYLDFEDDEDEDAAEGCTGHGPHDHPHSH